MSGNRKMTYYKEGMWQDNVSATCHFLGLLIHVSTRIFSFIRVNPRGPWRYIFQRIARIYTDF